MSENVTINGTAGASLGFFPIDIVNWRDCQLRYQSVVIPRRAGVTVTEPEADEPAQEITLRGAIRGTSQSDVWAKWDQLVAKSSETTLTLPGGEFASLRFDHDATREKRVKLTQVTKPVQAHVLHTRTWYLDVALTFTAFDPHWYDTSNQQVTGIGNSDVAIPLGTAPSRPRLVITGAATNPTITYKHFDGTTIEALGLTVTLGGGETVTVDLDALTISSALTASLASGGFFALDAIKHGSYGASQWPTLRCSTGSLTCTYRRAWRG